MRHRLAFLLSTLSLACSAVQANVAAPPTPAVKKRGPLLPVAGERSPRGIERAITTKGDVRPGVLALVGATLLLGDGRRIEDGTLVLKGGRIESVGARRDVRIGEGVEVVDVKGKFITPGLIDTHSHMGVYPAPSMTGTQDGNEMTDPTTPYVFSEHAFWPQDPAIQHAVAGGVTSAQILPGSGNLIGGRAVTIKLKPAQEARAMRVEGAPNGLKMACGENPKRVYGTTNRAPMSRMGNLAKMRQAFVKAHEYRHAQRAFRAEWDVWKKKYDDSAAKGDVGEDPGKEPKNIDRDLGLETLADVLDGKIKVHVHCYRADEMMVILALAKEFGFSISSFHHAVEAYKIAPVLAREGVAASVWADWWGFKLEAWDSVEENAAILEAAGAQAIIHSDSAIGIQRLNQEAAKALAAGRRLGLDISDDRALSWVTRNPARALGIDHLAGTLEAGKAADVVIWDRAPLSVYALAEQVFIDGERVFDRARAPESWSDFNVGSPVQGVLP